MNIQKFMPALLVAVALWAVSSCRMQEGEEGREGVVSVSIQPLEYMVDRLSGGALDVNVMVPAGASHATYSPTTSQFQKLSASGIYFRIGHLGYEKAFIGRLSEMNPGMEVLDLSEGLSLIRGEEIDHGDHVHEGGIDPHIWMSPAVMIQLLPRMKGAIIAVYPELSQQVEEYYPALLAEMEALHLELSELSEELSQKRFLIFHPALTYLARDYGFEQIPIERHGKEPSPALLAHIIHKARSHEVPVIFVQQEFDVRSARLVSEESGARIVQINPLAYHWFDSMREVMEAFKTYMQ